MLSRLLVALGGVACLAGPALFPPRPRLVWNASASAPIGLYRVDPAPSPGLNALVLVLPPPPLARQFAARGYLPAGVPLLKRIAARPGQLVCRRGSLVTVDRQPAAIARPRDRRGRSLPVWAGCRRIDHGTIFVLSPGIADALDGRYFGPLPRSALIGGATPLWLPEHAR